MRRAEPVEVRTVLPPQVQQVLEARGGDERRAYALALEERVRRHRRPVREPLHLPGTDGRRRCEHRLLLPTRGRHLRGQELPAVEQHRVGEGATDVHAQDRHGRNVSEQPTAARCHHPQVAGEGQVDLHGGGVVAWREWGDRGNPPVVFLHGTPGSRLFIPDRALDSRVITFDRPATGCRRRSAFRPCPP
jgi:hypothetical protein